MSATDTAPSVPPTTPQLPPPLPQPERIALPLLTLSDLADSEKPGLGAVMACTTSAPFEVQAMGIVFTADALQEYQNLLI